MAFVTCSWRPVNSVGPNSSSSSRQTPLSPAAAPASSAAAGAGPLLGHPLLEILDVDVAVALRRDLAGEVDREPERVVQEERVGAAHVTLLDELAEHVDAALQRGAERLLLAPDDLLHGLAIRDDLG